jgi:drug/metabolite transporter (DMT)-like permease
MESFKKYLGVCLLLLGVIFLVIYRFALPQNSLLVAGMVCEVAGILAYIFINRKA